MGLQGMLHRRRLWNINVSKDQLIAGLKSCEVCRRHRRMNRDTRLGTLNASTRPNDIVGMDFIEPLDGRYILVAVEFFSRRVQVEVCRNADEASVVRSLRRWVSDCGPIRKLVTDQGRQFTGDLVQQWCDRGGVGRFYTHVYDHRSNALVERCNRSVLETLRKLKMASKTERWWILIDQVERVMNGSFHKALGRTPFEAFYGTVQVHRQLVTKRREDMRKRNEGRREVVQNDLQEGSRVLVYEFENADRGRLEKLAAMWTDPHVIEPQRSVSS